MVDELESTAQREWKALLLGAGYFTQFVFVYIAVFMWGLFEGIVGMSEIRGGALAGATFQIGNGLSMGVLGFLLGIAVQSCIPRAARTGRWIWVPLTLFLLYAVPSDYIKFNWYQVVRDWFFYFHPGRDEGPIGRDLIVYPAWAAIWYSVGVQIISRRGRLSPD